MAVQHLVGEEGTLTGKYTVDVQGARGAIVGDAGTRSTSTPTMSPLPNSLRWTGWSLDLTHSV